MTIMYSSKSSDSSFFCSMALYTEVGGQCESRAGRTTGHPTCKRTWASGSPQADSCGVTASPCLPQSHRQPHTVAQLPSHVAAHTAVCTVQPLATHYICEDSQSYPMSPSHTIMVPYSAHTRTHTHTPVTHNHSLKHSHMQPWPNTCLLYTSPSPRDS